jgi:hypothetical protein
VVLGVSGMLPDFDFPGVDNHPKSGCLNFLAAAIAAGKKRQKHFCASKLNLQQHPVWARIILDEFVKSPNFIKICHSRAGGNLEIIVITVR